MPLLRNLWLNFVRVVRSLGRISLLLLWALLLAGLYVQIQVATLDGLTLPDPAKRALLDHLAALGLQADFARARFDPTGRILIEDVRLGDPKIPGALITARSLSTRVNPWLLLVGEFDCHELQVNGASLFRPVENQPDPFSSSPRSPFTTVAKVAQDFAFTLLLTHHDLVVTQLTGRVGAFAVSANGALRLPPATPSSPDLRAALAAYQSLAIELSSWDDGAHLLAPRVDLHLTPVDNQIAIADVVVDANGYPDKTPSVANGAGLMECGPMHLTARVPLLAPESDPVEITGDIEHATLPKLGDATAGRLHFILRGDLRRPAPPAVSFPGPYPTWWRLEATLNAVTSRARNFSTGPVAATLALDLGKISVDASVQVAGAPWGVHARADSLDHPVQVSLAGPVDHALLALAGELTGHDLGTIVQLAGPAQLDATVTITPDGKLSAAGGRLDAGAVRVAGVPLDAAAGSFTFDGIHLLCQDVSLKTGANVARGSYEMNTATLDYRFLLAGHAQPAALAGWFGSWWPALWHNAAFPTPPEADVDVQGRWDAPELTSVFVSAAADGASIGGIAFDEARARAFIRPGWEDVLSFSATQGARGVRGSGTLAWAAEGTLLRSVGFDLTTNLDPDQLAPLLGPEGVTWVAPYRFAQPPDIMLHGRLEGETAAGWAQVTVDLGLQSTGDLTYYGFPLRDLAAQLRVRDHTLELPSVTFGFAGGQLQGNAKVSAENGPVHHLSLNAHLTGANLGETIRTLEDYSAARQGLPAPATSKFQQRLATGRLDLTLTAEGDPTLPPQLHGQGHADITGADFGQIQIFGLLSTLLNHTLLNFSSMSLDTLHTDFALDGEKVSFPGGLTLSGPRAKIGATGDYQLDSNKLNFKVKIQPFEESRTLLGDVVKVVIKPIETAMEVNLQGTLEKPDWVFILGPTSLLRKITGALDQTPSDKK